MALQSFPRWISKPRQQKAVGSFSVLIPNPGQEWMEFQGYVSAHALFLHRPLVSSVAPGDGQEEANCP